MVHVINRHFVMPWINATIVVQTPFQFEPMFVFVPLVESGFSLLVDVATDRGVYDLRRQAPATKNTLQFFRLFRYAYPSSSFRCSRRRPSLLLSLVCASGRLSFPVGERYYLCVLPFCNLFPRRYIRRRLIPYYDSGPLH